MAYLEYPVTVRAGACANGQTICWQLLVGKKVAYDMYSSNIKDPAEAFNLMLKRISKGESDG